MGLEQHWPTSPRLDPGHSSDRIHEGDQLSLESSWPPPSPLIRPRSLTETPPPEPLPRGAS
jgi:hypothetical protein